MSRINIQYIWVEHYKCLENAEFNFSTKYDIHYDKDTNTLSCKKNENYIDGFFGENIDLTAVVGGNGAGKTTVLELLRDDYIEVMTKFIFVFERNGKALIYYTFEKQPTLKGFKESFGCEPQLVPQSEDPQITDPNPCHRQKIKTVLLSEAISNPDYDMSRYYANFHAINLSSTNLIYISDDLINYFHKDIKKQITFNYEYNSKNKVLPFKLRDVVDVHINYNNNDSIEAFLKKYKKGYTEQEVSEMQLFSKWRINSHDSDFDIFKKMLCIALFDFFIDRITNFVLLKKGINIEYVDSNIYELVRISIQASRNINNNNWVMMKCFFETAQKLCRKHLTGTHGVPQIVSIIITKHKEYIEYIESIENSISLKYISNKQFAIPTDQIENFFNAYQEVADTRDFLNFSWGYSSGEMAMFNLFSRFYSIKDEISKYDNALILIDEADMLYHPEWQQKYIKSLVEFLPTIYEGTHLQIILATHSPIMLSDVPKQNVIYLKQGENGNTIVDPNSRHKESFGQNIFRLFNDAFFLEEGAMGDFAREKLEKLVERIHDLPNITNNYNAVYKAIQHEIDIIGDNFIREKLQAELEKHLNIPNRVQLLEDQMAKIQEQIKNLKKQEKTKND